MKELLTDQQADWVVLGLAVLATLISLGWGLAKSRGLKPSQRKLTWFEAFLFALSGPVLWIFWDIYNSIEDHYGLDSVKALEINFGIVLGIAALFVLAHGWIRRTVPGPEPKRRRS